MTVAGALLAPGEALAQCGNAGQRACCLGETGFACVASAVEVPGCSGSCTCGGFNPLGTQASSRCVAATPCGGVNQRACCVGEGTACNAGLVQQPQANSGYCTNSTLGIQSSGVCRAVSACGGADQRACCVGEGAACDPGLVEQPQPNSGQCGSLAWGVQSSGVCRATTPCGGEGQRACCLLEAGFGACQAGFVEIEQPDSGQCSNLAWGIQSNGTCQRVSACGGEGERACCLGEAGFGACEAGLAEVPLANAGQCGNLPFGIQSSGICAPISACGGKGQRACCVGEAGPACQAGLIEVFGCSGDCACGGGFASSGMCTVIESIAEPGTGWAPSGSPDPPLRGYADLHLHLFGHLGHGSGVFAGAPYDPVGGIDAALRPDYGTDLDLVKKDGAELGPPSCPSFLPGCGQKLFHGDHLLLDPLFEGSDSVGAATKDGGDRAALGAESNLGAPLFNGWPTWNTTTHQQAYHVWLERAWRGGLRLTVMLAVTNEALCLTTKRLRGTVCDDGMAAIDAQLEEARRFEAFLDARAGGPGQGWFRIVTTPQQARSVIAAGKLAVVLGIEMDNLFNCKFAERDPTSGECTEASVRAFVDEYYAKGVRHIFPVHNFDNAFGSPATWQDAIHIGNRGVEGRWWDAEDCPGDYGFKLNDGFGTTLFNVMISLFGFGIGEIPGPHPGDASCNALGLTELGEVLIDQLIRRGIVIDVDHMSRRAFDETLAIAESTDPPYPVVASHVQFFDLNVEPIRHERMRTRAQLERIRDVGGMVAAMLKDDQQDTDEIGRKFHVAYGSVVDDCRHSSKTWAQMYQYAVDVMGGPVAFGSDFNGVAGHTGPRFGSEACGGDPGPLGNAPEAPARLAERRAQLLAGNRVEYPFTLPGFGRFERQVTGHKTFDFNVDGLAHVGLLPDLVADLREIGLSDGDLDPLFGSAEAYVALWEQARAVPEPGPATTALAAFAALALLGRRGRR